MFNQELEAMESEFNSRYDDNHERYAASQLDSEYGAYCDSGCPSWEEWVESRDPKYDGADKGL